MRVRIDNQGIIDKWSSKGLYDSDVRASKRWCWLLANEPKLHFECILGTENIRADLLSIHAPRRKRKRGLHDPNTPEKGERAEGQPSFHLG